MKIIHVLFCLLTATILSCQGDSGVASSSVSTLAGNGSPGDVDGSKDTARFNSPDGVTVGPTGDIYVTDTGNNKVKKISEDGTVTTVASGFNSPDGIVTDSDGNVYVADQLNHQIKKIDSDGTVTVFAGSGVQGSNNANGESATFDNPTGITIDSSGNLYVADSGNHLIRKIDSSGNVTSFAGSGVAGDNDATGAAAQFDSPHAVTVDSSGNVYVTDMGNHKVKKITPAQVVTSIAGDGTAGYSDNDIGTSAKLDTPHGLTTDDSGNVYVSDQNNDRIRHITPSGRVITYAGDGQPSLTDGAAGKASFNKPRGLARDSQGNLYVCDYNNHAIRKISR